MTRFDPERFFEVAEFNAGAQGVTAPDEEARLRTAVGRAYYASFLAARMRFAVTRSRSVHQEVIKQLRRRDRAAGDQLDKLERLRTVADYEPVVQSPLHRDWQRNWQFARTYATHVLRRLRTLT